MQTNKIRAALRKYNGSSYKTFWIIGYTTTKGAVIDYQLRSGFHDVGGYQGTESLYERVLEDCVHLASNKLIEVPDYAAYGISFAEMEQAMAEQLESWKKSLKKIQETPYDKDEAQKKDKEAGLEYDHTGRFYTSESDPQLTIIRNVQCENFLVHKRSQDQGSLGSKNPVVRAKELFRRASPMQYYIPRLNLRPDNITTIRLQSR